MKFYRIVLVLMILISLPVYSQNAEKGKKEDKADKGNEFKIRLKWKTPLNIAFSYSMTEKTRVTRVFSDSSKIKYERDATVFFTIRGADLPKEGFQNVAVSIDSLKYVFRDPEHDIYFDSQDDNNSVPPSKFDDFLPYLAILGMQYELVYSPYSEVVKVEGDKYQEKLASIDDPSTRVKDSTLYLIWKHAPDITNLAFYSDVSKQILPTFPFDKDTSWTQNLLLKIDGVFLKDSAKFKLDDYTPNIIVIKGESQKLLESSASVLPPLIPKMLDVGNAAGDVKYRFELDPRGLMDFIEINFAGEIDLKVGSDIIKQYTTTDYTWKLNKTYKW